MSSENMFFLILLAIPLLSLAMIAIFMRAKKGHHNKYLVIFAGNILFLLFFLSLLTLSLEIYYRFIFDSTDSIILTNVSRRWYKKHYKANKSGFRDDIEYERAASPGMGRITFVGDSFTAGQGFCLRRGL